MTAPTATDPHKFLEDVLGDEALSWVKERNADCISALGDPEETENYKRILAIYDSKDKIPSICQIGRDGMFYNFWRDDKHVQGIWRKTTLESFKTAQPEWQTVLDLDALPPPTTDTASTWVWHGSTLLDEGPDGKWDRALISLSPGGSDADTTREIDLVTEKFIEPDEGGFAMPTAAKTRIAYRSRNECIVGTDFTGDGSTMTDSGYPRVLKSWKRGTPISEAVTIFEGEQADVSVSQYAYPDRGGIVHEFQRRSITFYTGKYKYRCLTPEQLQSTTADKESTSFKDIPIQDDASISTFGNSAIIKLRSDWNPTGCETTFKAGALLVAPMDEVMNDEWSNMMYLFEPTSTTSLLGRVDTADYIVLAVLEDVRTKLVIWKHDGDGKFSLLPSEGDSVPVGEDIVLSNVNRDTSIGNSVFLWRDGYLKPDTYELIPDIGEFMKNKDTAQPLKSKPAMFDAKGLCVEQHFATSKDGTKIPYFIIHRENMVLDGNNATFVDAYGGFEISMTPYYAASVGAAWLEKGGVQVIANIRGGGEYGPKWHQAALKANRYKCYEDMEAVAQDLIDRKITTPKKLACIGGSNGGLMVGNMITRPLSSTLYGTAVCQVPLLDMKTYSKLLAGASWMDEYGNPDKPEEWEFLRRHSPYQLLRHDNLGLPEEGKEEGETVIKNADWKCPKVLFTTSTRDDRVHPAHARKMVRALLDEAKPKGKAETVLYWENIEGGHGGAANNKQRAHMWALTYTFLAKSLELNTLEN